MGVAKVGKRQELYGRVVFTHGLGVVVGPGVTNVVMTGRVTETVLTDERLVVVEVMGESVERVVVGKHIGGITSH